MAGWLWRQGLIWSEGGVDSFGKDKAKVSLAVWPDSQVVEVGGFCFCFQGFRWTGQGWQRQISFPKISCKKSCKSNSWARWWRGGQGGWRLGGGSCLNGDCASSLLLDHHNTSSLGVFHRGVQKCCFVRQYICSR